MPQYGTGDLDVFTSDMGVSVTVGAVTVRGLMDVADEEMLAEVAPALQGRIRSVRVKSGALALASKGDITVDGTAYKVHSFHAVHDGLFTVVLVVGVN